MPIPTLIEQEGGTIRGRGDVNAAFYADEPVKSTDFPAAMEVPTMRMIRLVVCIGIVLLIATIAYAGGVSLRHPTLNGRGVAADVPLPIAAGQSAHLCFDFEDYSYSGARREDRFVVFSLELADRVTKEPSSRDLFYKRLVAGRSSGTFGIEECVDFTTPSALGLYAISYNQVVMFPSDFGRRGLSDEQAAGFARRHTSLHPYWERLLLIQVSEASASASTPVFSTYLQLNGKVPALDNSVEPGLDKPPAVFSWFVKPARMEVEHRYRLYPVEADWSPWTSDSSATYYYIAAGAYQFQVVSRVRTPGHEWTEGNQAQYQFFLEKPLIAKPITKASGGTSTRAVSIRPQDIYLKSRALLLAVTEYDDKQFGPLPYAENDVKQLGAALSRTGFDQVTPLKGPLTKAQVTGAVDQFVRAASHHERLLIYISTHGFADPLDKSKAYVVTKDCHPNQPSTCLSLQEIDGLIEPVLRSDKQLVRHLLLLLDTCSSGLGVISKFGQFNELSVAAKEGSHMMTAGLEDQEAEQDPGLKMSTFAYYLSEGLSGKADYTGDGVVTLARVRSCLMITPVLQFSTKRAESCGYSPSTIPTRSSCFLQACRCLWSVRRPAGHSPTVNRWC